MQHDVAVVGAGIGGIALALRLAREGRRVAVVDPTPAGTFRVGESLDWEAPVYLERLGFSIDRWVAEGKATYKRGAVATSATRPGVEVEIGFSPFYRLLMRLVGRQSGTIHANRERVDPDLFDALRAAGVTLIADKARAVHTDGDRVTGVSLAGGGALTARFYVDGTGSAALFRKTFDIGADPIGPRKVVVRARFDHPYDGRGTRIRTDDTLSEAAWVWDINVSETMTDIGIVVAQEDFARLRRELGALDRVFLHQTVEKHADLAWLGPLVTSATDFWTCTFQDLVAHRSGGENWIAVGEAAFVVDAILSSGFTSALRSGWNAAAIVSDALARGAPSLCPRMRRAYHEKTAAHVRTIDGLIDVLWYRGRLRDHTSLALNVLSILVLNFNLNHLHTRVPPSDGASLTAIKLLHRAIDAFVPFYDRTLTEGAIRKDRLLDAARLSLRDGAPARAG